MFFAEIGDKTMFATLAAAIESPAHLLLVGTASASALVMVTGLTVLAATAIPMSWIKIVQRIGAVLMIAYGGYMIFS